MENIKLYDKYGRIYDLDVCGNKETATFIYISFQGIPVGQINWIIKQEANLLELADINIFEPALIKKPWWSRLFFIKWKPPSFRQIGLGNAMLNFVIEQAEILKVDAIVGRISGDESDSDKYLESFYMKHGFIINGASLYRKI